MRSVSERRSRLCLFERVPGENYYSLKMLKGNIEPRRNSPGSSAHLRVDCIRADSTLNPEAKSRCSLDISPWLKAYGQVQVYAVLPVLLLFRITLATFYRM